MSIEIYDIDGTLTTSGDNPRGDVINHLRNDAAEGAKIIIVSARPIARLDETKSWLQDNNVPVDEIHLNDFEGAGQGPSVGLAFKAYKYGKIVEQYGAAEIDYAVDNDADVREMARGLGLVAYSPDELVALDEQGGEMESNSVEKIDMRNIETRAISVGDFTVQETDLGQKTFTGYAALFNQESEGLPFTEIIAPGAFKRSLSRASAGERIIAFLFGHDETRALATTASGRLKLTEDSVGLRVEAQLDAADPDAAKVISMLTHERQAAGMSFAFHTPKGGDSWDGNKRTISEAALVEVSILSPGQTPAYPATLSLASVRKVSEDKLGIEAERLITTLESIKAGRELSNDDVEVIDTVRAKLAPKQAGIDPTIAAARVLLERLRNDAI
jgi:HK97 family phage prohead protease